MISLNNLSRIIATIGEKSRGIFRDEGINVAIPSLIGANIDSVDSYMNLTNWLYGSGLIHEITTLAIISNISKSNTKFTSLNNNYFTPHSLTCFPSMGIL